MADFVRAGRRLINLEHVIEITVWPASQSEALRVEMDTTGVTGRKEMSADLEYEMISPIPHQIILTGREAADFLESVRYAKKVEDGFQNSSASDLAEW